MSAELYHYGILGMKWGVRRTPEQLDRRRKVTEKKSSSSSPGQSQKPIAKKQKQLVRSPHKMTDDDLRRAINRLQLEKQYKDLTRKEISAGKKLVTSVLSETVKKTVAEYLSKELKKKLDEVFKQTSVKDKK